MGGTGRFVGAFRRAIGECQACAGRMTGTHVGCALVESLAAAEPRLALAVRESTEVLVVVARVCGEARESVFARLFERCLQSDEMLRECFPEADVEDAVRERAKDMASDPYAVFTDEFVGESYLNSHELMFFEVCQRVVDLLLYRRRLSVHGDVARKYMCMMQDMWVSLDAAALGGVERGDPRAGVFTLAMVMPHCMSEKECKETVVKELVDSGLVYAEDSESLHVTVADVKPHLQQPCWALDMYKKERSMRRVCALCVMVSCGIVPWDRACEWYDMAIEGSKRRKRNKTDLEIARNSRAGLSRIVGEDVVDAVLKIIKDVVWW